MVGKEIYFNTKPGILIVFDSISQVEIILFIEI